MTWRQKLSLLIRALRRSVPDRPFALPWWPISTSSGLRVDHNTALTYSAVWACVQVISGSVSQMGWHVYRPQGRGRERVPSHPAEWLLDIQTNPETTAFAFREALLQHALLWGNGYAEIERDMAGRPVWLWQIDPARVHVDRTLDGALIYDIANRGNSNTVLDPAHMLHLRGLGDGVVGLSVIAFARQSIGLGLAAEKFGGTFFGNSATPSGYIKYPGDLAPTAKQNISTSFVQTTSGDQAHGVPVLDLGMEWHPLSMSNEDSKFLQTRTFQVLEVCRWFNVKPHKVAELTRATFSNIEESNIDHVVDTCVPWVLRLEQEANIKLFGQQNRQNLYTKMNIASLLRGKVNDRYAAYAAGRQWGWLSVNDIRAWEDLNPLPPHIGDLYLTPANMIGLPLDPAAPRVGVPASAPTPPPPLDADERFQQILAHQREAQRNGHHGAHP